MKREYRQEDDKKDKEKWEIEQPGKKNLRIEDINFNAFFPSLTAAPPKLSGERQVDFTGFADHFKSLKCNIEGGTTYEWFHNGSKITRYSSMFIMIGNRIYVMERPVTDTFQGTYQCKASNDNGTLWGPKINVHFTRTSINKFD
jgi:hypothetical protein